MRHRRIVKALLLKEDSNLGAVGDVVNVRPGFARNYLFPRGDACPVTADALARVARVKVRAREERARRARAVEELAKSLGGLSLTLEERAGEEGHL
ncbi:MAG: 50S ribosomal protein L9, partial [Planctomycetota bacterium]